ncbi:protein of unknown function (plasmid) [Azospirillum baldaniorum]|uniref:Uncharacterized protein n=1 Tax=Azospirillum baldaniorum TaxID=1064539 RepID=A0A9P1JTZ2_9PROT|nr:protein of unknown function [Azospirillum baldaniorum]
MVTGAMSEAGGRGVVLKETNSFYGLRRCSVFNACCSTLKVNT